MSANLAIDPRILSVSVREGRMFVERILLTCGLPSGYVHGVRECVLLSQAIGLGGLQHLLEECDALDMDAFGRMQVRDSEGALLIDAAGLHAWVVLPVLADLAVDEARKAGRANVKVTNIAAIAELEVIAALARRYGASAHVSISPDATEATIVVTNASRPRSFEQWDPVMHAAMRDGFAVEETLWRAVHARSNKALAPDSVVSRRHAGPVIVTDDGTIVGRQPSDDDFDMNMLRKVAAQPR